MTKSRVKAIRIIEGRFQLDTICINCRLFRIKIDRIWLHGCIRNTYRYENVSYEEFVTLYYFSYLSACGLNVVTTGWAVKKIYLS